MIRRITLMTVFVSILILFTAVPVFGSPLLQSYEQTFDVRGREADGKTITVKVPGIYEFAVVGGAYSPWRDNSVKGGQWRSLLVVFSGERVHFDNTAYGPDTPDLSASLFQLGCLPDFGDRASAASCGRGSSAVRVRLSKGDRLTFVAVDQRSAYGDNRGVIEVGIDFTPDAAAVPASRDVAPPPTPVPPTPTRVFRPTSTPTSRPTSTPIPTATATSPPPAIAQARPAAPAPSTQNRASVSNHAAVPVTESPSLFFGAVVAGFFLVVFLVKSLLSAVFGS